MCFIKYTNLPKLDLQHKGLFIVIDYVSLDAIKSIAQKLTMTSFSFISCCPFVV
jgi:hypothetical protein